MQATLSINNIVNTNNPDNITFDNAFYPCLNRLNAQLEQVRMSDLIFTHITELLPNVQPFEHISGLKNINGVERQDYYKVKAYLNTLTHVLKLAATLLEKRFYLVYILIQLNIQLKR
ncbi:hypothetical protein [Abyssogena phaseoliformis symbiont]|uniref:hypothetical protein n=1 Tax=Abyssogena phaseoliformis symbiont TaxID=596095 RepID=UPI0019157DC4|nr:hypothetical protein [Abyssogena phaseoliformis symbiont]